MTTTSDTADTIVSPNPPADPPPPPPLTAEVARPSAHATLSPVAAALEQAMSQVTAARSVASTWTDEFWAVCGYDEAAVTAALAQLERLVNIYGGTAGLSGMHDFSADAAVLEEQAPQ